MDRAQRSPTTGSGSRDLRLRALLDAPEAFGSTHEREAARTEDDWRAFAAGWDGAARQAAFVAVDEDGRWIGLAVGVVGEADTSLANLYSMWVEPARARPRGRPAPRRDRDRMGGRHRRRAPGALRDGGERSGRPSVPDGGVRADRDGTRCARNSTSRSITLRRALEVPPETVDGLMAEQLRYYEDRAPVYDELLGIAGAGTTAARSSTSGGSARPPRSRRPSPTPPVCACWSSRPGTGIWTRRLAPGAARLVAVDASPAMLARNLEAVGDPRVEYVQADLFEWAPPDGETFDLIAFGFFLSHAPPDRLEAFWARLRSWLAPGGRVWFCDDAAGPGRPYFGATVEGVPIANTRAFDTDTE